MGEDRDLVFDLETDAVVCGEIVDFHPFLGRVKDDALAIVAIVHRNDVGLVPLAQAQPADDGLRDDLVDALANRYFLVLASHGGSFLGRLAFAPGLAPADEYDITDRGQVQLACSLLDKRRLISLHDNDRSGDKHWPIGRGTIDFEPFYAAVMRHVPQATVSLEVAGNVEAKMGDLRKLGFRLAMDDVGSGYSGLKSIAEIRPDYLKIDMSLVRDLHLHSIKRELISTIRRFSDSTGIIIVAEGVEAEAEVASLSEVGVRCAQGYLFAEPDSPPRAPDWKALDDPAE